MLFSNADVLTCENGHEITVRDGPCPICRSTVATPALRPTPEPDPGQDGRPEAFPLPRLAANNEYLASYGPAAFGWRPDRDGNLEFVLSKYRTLGGLKPVATFSCDEDGWAEAWNLLARDHPKLAVAVKKRLVGVVASKERAQKRLELEALIADEGDLGELPGTLLGGYGFAAPPGTDCEVHFTRAGIRIVDQQWLVELAHLSYARTQAIEFSGPGRVSTGGRFIGGGFGLIGAAEGMIAANVLNALTRRTDIQTMVRIQASDIELFLFCSVATPSELRIRFSEVLGEINRSTPADGPGPAGLADQLAKLRDLFALDVLTEEEFAAAKARLLG